MKRITWQHFLDIVNDSESLVFWNNNICDKIGWTESFCFSYCDEGNLFSCDIGEKANETILVTGNTFFVFDSEEVEEIQIEIFRKVPWVIE